MVFESLVADLLNKYLGEYVDNLDRSQLKIGIWGGDVVLKDLSLKQSALDDLRLPVKTVNGFLGKLTLKIPWKNLYSAPVEASVEDLYLLVVPNTEIRYDPIKEEKWKQEAKQAEINKVEEAKKKEKEKDKPKPDDGFTEKLATQIVRNVQISIKNIHIRYEDRVNTEGKPFALGITLGELLVTTTDSMWNPHISQDMTSMIYKILSVGGLSVYWNSRVTSSFLDIKNQGELYKAFHSGIATGEDLVSGYQYMLGPINAGAKMRINSKPESDGSNFSIPKLTLNLDLWKLQVKISKAQYQDLMVFLDSMDRMSRAAPYRKYRPNVKTYKGHVREWWQYAYTCVLEEEVRRRRRNWDWLHIQNHRKICKDYAKAYQQKLATTKPPAEVVKTCEHCEKCLDVLNIILIRQKIEVEVERRGLLEQQSRSQAGWFSGWWGGGSKTDDSAKTDIKKQFEEAMTPAEKEKLYRAIGYQENAAPAEYPVEFVAVDLKFFLQSLMVEVRDGMTQVLSGSISSVTAKFQQRPAGQAIKATVEMQQFLISGLRQNEVTPQLVQGQVDTAIASSEAGPLLDISFEVNPLDGECDQRVHILSRPLQLIYDALTINKIIDVFTVEQNTVITQLQSAANMKIAEIKQKSALGLQYAIQKHTKLDVKVELMGVYGFLPHGGLYTDKEQALIVVNLGRMLFYSITRPTDEQNVHNMHQQGTAETDIMIEMLNRSYDRFVVRLMDAQVKMVLPGEPYKIEQSDDQSLEQYLIKPISLEINIDKSLIPDDHRIPKLKVFAKLPSITLKIAETRLLSLIALLVSIPLPESKTEEEPDQAINLYASQSSLSVMDIAKATKFRDAKKKSTNVNEEDFVQFTELTAKFELNELAVAVFRKSDGGDIPLGDFKVLKVEAEMFQQTYDLNFKLRLGGLSLYQDYEGKNINVINTPMAEGKEDYLFVVSYCKVNKDSPEFHSKHGSVVQLLEMDFSRLDVLVHQESLLDAIHWANKVQAYVTEATAKVGSSTGPGKITRPTTPVKNLQQKTAFKLLDTIREEGNTRQVKRSRKPVVDTIDLKLRANLGEISLTLENRLRLVGRMLIKGGESVVIMKRSYTQVNARLSNFEFIDLRSNTKHPKVLSILGSEEALTSQVVMFNNEAIRESDNINMSVTANIACFRVVFLNYVVMSLLDFLNNFASAQAAIIEASAAAAEAAKANMQQAYKEAFRVRLNIQLKAPIILVPANSMSLDAVLVDFGVLTMLNTFQDLHVTKDDKELTAVIDNLHLELQNLKVSRVKLGEDMNVAVECLLLQPISFQLTVKRNLSADWFTSVPNLDVSGRLESIHAKLTQEDYTMIMSVLSLNLGEVPTFTAVSAIEPSTSSNTIKSASTSKSQSDKPKEDDGSTCVEVHGFESKDKPKENVHTNIKFTFTLDSLIIDLFKGGMKEIIKNTCPMRNSDGLARFTLYVLSIKGSMLSDGTLSTSVLLLDCLLDDTRTKQSGKICRYMERKSDEKNNRSMVDITFQLKDNAMFVDMRVYSFILILNLNHLLEVSTFFTESKEQTANIPTTTVSKTSKTSSGLPGTSSSFQEMKETQESDKMLSVSIKCEQPDIILVENMDDINTNAIIMNVEITMKLRMQGTHLFISGALTDLELFSCCFNPERRKETKAQILRKATLNVQGSTPPGQGLHMDVATTNLRLAVSPGTIELLNRVMVAFTQAKIESDEESEVEKDYSKIWTVGKLTDTDYWFLKTEVAEDAAEMISLEQPKPKLDEVCLLQIPSLVITLEAGVGTKTLPMLLLETNMQATVRNWSSKLSVDSTTSLQMSYYNSQLALWEPLIEPIEKTRPGFPSTHIPWEVYMQLETNDIKKINNADIVDGLTEILNAKPKMVINISSKETMEITITKTCLDVLKNLGVAFNNAIFKPESKKVGAFAPYIVQNDLGLSVTVILTEEVFKIYDPEGQKGQVNEVVLDPGASVNLCLVEEEYAQSLVGQTSLVREKFLQIKVTDIQPDGLDLPVARADKRYFSLQHRGASNDPWGLVSDVQVIDGATVIHLRGIIQVQNHFNIPINVYFMTKKGDEVELIGTVEPYKHLNIPLQAIYTLTTEFFFSVEGFTLSLKPFVWKDLQKSLSMTNVLQCNAKNIEDKEPFFIKVVGELEQVYNELSNRHTMASKCYNIHLRPTVILKNFLPVDIVVCTQGILGENKVAAGQRMQIPTAEPGQSTVVIRISQYLDKDWSCKHEIAANPAEFSVWTFQSYDSSQRVTLDLGMHCVNDNGSLKFALYCPFWMINKTGFMISYRKSSKPGREDSAANPTEQSDDSSNFLYHPPHLEGPIMFSFRAKDFFGRKKACIKLMKGEWSDKFSLDVAGSSGIIKCKVDNMIYQIGVHIQLTNNSLTKLVTFTPYHVLVNHCKLPVEIHEVKKPEDPWVKVEPGEVLAFWPKAKDDKNPSELVVKLGDSSESTIPFPYNRTLNCLLKLNNNKHGGVNVDVQITEGAVYITFTSYATGMAPALIINHSPYDIPLVEKDAKENSILLPAGHEVYFTWSTVKEPHSLIWCEKYSNDLRKDEIGEFNVSPSVKLFWVTFLDGMQRVLLFTEHPEIARDAELAGEMEVFDQEIVLAVHGLGVSLVDNISHQEVIYLGITSSGTIWEAKKHGGRRFKAIPQDDSLLIEEAWKLYTQELMVGGQPNNKVCVENYLIDFATMEIQKPSHKEIRRTYNQGLWVQMRSSPHQNQYHAKINRLQIDNQMYDCVFPVVFAPVPPPKSVNKENAMKPFVEVSIIQRVNEHTIVKQYKYFKALIQEFHVKVDIGFVNALVKMFEAGATTDDEEAELFKEDFLAVDKSLISHVELLSSQEQKNFYDILHFSPLKIHVSFSMSGGGVQATPLPPVLNVLMQSLGVTLTEIHDVVLQLSYFERNYTFLNHKQLQSEAQMHYRGQLIKQFYVLVLGLDVLGNPYGLVVGITEGVQDLFYEPFQGAIQGPGEFAEGLVLGVKSLFGHTIGGAAGAVSRITGAMGKGIAALTFDDDYQRKRQEALNYRPKNMQEGLAHSGRGLFMGVVEGVGGVVTKPISGARQGGMMGLLKGLGTGTIGLVTRPAAGVVDFASDTFNTVKRATELGEEVTRLRNPRYFSSDNLVRPYCKLEADGNKILKELEKGKYYATDVYAYHTRIGNERCRDILLLTDKRMLVLSPSEIFGGYQVEFTYVWGELSEPPTIVPKGIQIKTGEPRKRLFHSSDHLKVIFFNNDDIKKLLVDKITDLMYQGSGTSSFKRSGTSSTLRRSPT